MVPKMKERAYTIKLHAHRLSLVLKRNDLCHKCPARKRYQEYVKYKNDPCKVCREFIHLCEDGCPCGNYGEELARKKSKEALKEYYARV